MLNKPHASIFCPLFGLNKPSMQNKAIRCYISQSRVGNLSNTIVDSSIPVTVFLGVDCISSVRTHFMNEFIFVCFRHGARRGHLKQKPFFCWPKFCTLQQEKAYQTLLCILVIFKAYSTNNRTSSRVLLR